MIFFKNLWFFFWTDFSRLHKMQSEFYKLRAQIGVLELFKRKLIESKLEVVQLKREKRLLESKGDREQIFEEKASMRTKLNRWSQEVEIDSTTARELVLMYELLEKVNSRIPRKVEKTLAKVEVKPKVVQTVGLGGSMR